jgi:hypothetical protein
MNPDYLETRELYHHGILGMKWGHRKPLEQPADGNYDYTKKEMQDIKSGKAKMETDQEYTDKMAKRGKVVGQVIGAGIGANEGYKAARSILLVANKDKPISDKRVKVGYAVLISGGLLGAVGGMSIGGKGGAMLGKHFGNKMLTENKAVKDVKYDNQ